MPGLDLVQDVKSFNPPQHLLVDIKDDVLLNSDEDDGNYYIYFTPFKINRKENGIVPCYSSVETPIGFC